MTEVGASVDAILREAQRSAEETVRQAETHAAEIRRQAEEQSQLQAVAYLEEVRDRVDAFAEQRVTRLSELTDGLITQAEAIDERLEASGNVRRQLYDLVAALGQTAEAVAREHAQADLALPSIAERRGAAAEAE